MRPRVYLPALAAILVAAPAAAQQGAKPPVPYSAYDGWNAIRSTALSPDGHWLVYSLVPEDGDGTLVARNLATGAEHRAPRGENPAISADGRYVVFAVAPTRAARDAAKKKAGGKAADAPHAGFGAMDLASGAVFTADDVASFKLPESGGDYVAFLHEPPKPAKPSAEAGTDAPPAPAATKPKPGADLVVRDLARDTQESFPGVTAYVWAKGGRQLAYATRDGVFVWSPGASPRPVLQGRGEADQLTWNDQGTELAFVSDVADAAANPPVYHLYRSAADAPAAELPESGLPRGLAVSPHGKLTFSRGGGLLYFGIAPPPPPTRKNAPPAVQVDVWSWTDKDLQPMQKMQAEADRDASTPAVIALTAAGPGPMVALGTTGIPDLRLSADGATAVLATDVPYELASSWEGGDAEDFYAVNPASGTRRLLLRDASMGATLSPGGKYLLYFQPKDNHWHTVRVADGRDATLAPSAGVHFEDERWDQPSAANPYGVAGWTANDDAVVLYDRYDLWTAPPDGAPARNLTAGAGRREHIAFRFAKLDPTAKFLPAGPWLLAATNEDTLATGFYRLLSPDSAAAPVRLYWRDADLGRPVKAKNADTLVFSEQRFDEFPDLWASNLALAAPRKVTDANPQQARYRWGTAKLIHYINRDGKRLAAALYTPAGFDPHKKYPLMVYIYERLSQNLNHYVPPAPGTSINLTRYVSHGYVVLEPDIVYDIGHPGDSALKCVLPAIDTVQAMGFIDPARIAIQGHSWGGYEVAYMVTRTNRFRAVEAGAVVANMTSAYGGIRWASGKVREFQYEHTQSRIGGTPWDDSLLYLENSPLFSVETVHTPYLTIQNDGDDAVPWYQGIEFFTALRRLRKPAWLFVFNGEKHGLRQRDNQKYWTVRLDEYFDYWLKGAPEPDWMKNGVPYLQRGQDRVDKLYAAPQPKP